MAAEKSKQEQHLHIIMENTPDIIILLDSKTNFLSATQSFINIMRIPGARLLHHKTFRQVFSSFLEHTWLKHMEDIFEKAFESGETQMYKDIIDLGNSGDLRHYSISISPFTYKHNINDGLLIIFRDLTDIINTKEQVYELQEIAQRQQIFIGGLTHEFKTPMTSLMLHTEMLLSSDVTQEDMENSLTHIHAQCRWLERLTQKLLKLITLNEEVELRPESIPALFDDVKQSTAESLRERQTPLVIQCGKNVSHLNIDYDLMKSLLINLIENASKASGPGQSIFLRAYDTTLEIQDHGHGIPAEDVARITGPFYIVDRSRNKLKGGSGLGLALVQNIADAHHAQLSIESEMNVGTIMRVIFP
jgi:PAS domain S-box-containing protein